MPDDAGDVEGRLTTGTRQGAEGRFLTEMSEGLESAELRCFRSITHGPLMREVSGFAVTFEPGRVAPVGIDLERIQSKVDHYADG
jgi:hypothetical protein